MISCTCYYCARRLVCCHSPCPCGRLRLRRLACGPHSPLKFWAKSLDPNKQTKKHKSTSPNPRGLLFCRAAASLPSHGLTGVPAARLQCGLHMGRSKPPPSFENAVSLWTVASLGWNMGTVNQPQHHDSFQFENSNPRILLQWPRGWRVHTFQMCLAFPQKCLPGGLGRLSQTQGVDLKYLCFFWLQPSVFLSESAFSGS